MKHKLYCVFAKESIKKMNGIRGKMCTQAGHAYVHSLLDSQKRFPDFTDSYLNGGPAYKITLVVDTVEELEELEKKYKKLCGCHLVTDKGLTVFKEPTTTCLGIGPISEDMVGEDIKSIKTFC